MRFPFKPKTFKRKTSARRRKGKQNRRNKNELCFDALEERRCLASFGWDGPGLGSATLTYFIGPVPEGVDQAVFEDVVEEALDVWSAVANVHFNRTDTPGLPDSLDFTFDDIDGIGGVLAAAHFPDDINPNPVAGDIQFDAGEKWEIGNGRGDEAYDLLFVTVHEVGHALGLEHGEDPDSVMHQLVTPDEYFRELTSVDVEAILKLYGDPSSNDTFVSTPSIDHGAVLTMTPIPQSQSMRQPGHAPQQLLAGADDNSIEARDQWASELLEPSRDVSQVAVSQAEAIDSDLGSDLQQDLIDNLQMHRSFNV